MSELASADIGRLSELLGEELKLYGKIHKQTEEQTGLLAKDDIEGFNGSLEKSAKLIKKIKGLHQESDTLMQSYVSLTKSGKEADSDIGDIDALKSQIREVIADCKGLNEDNQTAMKGKIEEQTKKIDEQSAKRKGIGGYTQAVPNTPEVFDTKT